MKPSIPLIALLVLTLVMGAATLWLVQREADRMAANLQSVQAAQQQSLDDQAATFAASIVLAMTEIRQTLMQTLAQAPPQRLGVFLADLPEQNVFVAAAGLWQQPHGLIAGNLKLTDLTPLPWQTTQTPARSAMPAPEAMSKQLPQQAYAQQQVVERRRIDNLARGGDATMRLGMTAEATRAQDASDQIRSGWQVFTRQGQPTHLGWWFDANRGQARVLELDNDALAIQLQALLPVDGRRQVTWSLVTSPRAGDVTLSKQAALGKLQGAIVLGEDLPGWQLRYTAPLPVGVVEPDLFRWLGSLMVLALCAAMGVGALILQRQRTLAEREARTRTTFLASVSHELKTPLSAIALYSEMLEGGRVTEAQRQHQYLATIRREAARLERLVGNLLHHSRREREPLFRLNIQPLALGALVRESLLATQPALEAAGMHVTNDIADEGPTIRGDPDAIKQILGNLIDNAIKYAASGGRLQVQIACDPARHRATVRIADQGPGVADDFRGRLFEPFAHEGKRLEQTHSGLGLGLSIARNLASAMQGELAYTPGPQGGAVFTLHLPMETS